MSTQLHTLEAQDALAAIDVELARALTRLASEQDQHVALTIALTSRNLREGHVCTELTRIADSELLNEEGVATGIRCPSLDELTSALMRSPLVASQLGGGQPLILDAHGRLYLARYFDHEQRIAEHITRLATQHQPPPALPQSELSRLFPSAIDNSVDLQRDAVLASRGRGLSVIVGGPGTGKTSTVVRLLALLVEDARKSQQPPPRILLVAPTGKAAQRLSESIGRARDSLAIDDATRAAIPSNALTIHRALKASGGSSTQFQHGPSNPLGCDLLLLDEASMVDLALMRRLLDALPKNARLVMLGDPDQLSAVEAGGVLSDLCRAAEQPSSPLAHCVSRLRQSYRYDPSSGIARLANAVHAQDSDEAVRILRAGLPDVALFPAPPRSDINLSTLRSPLAQHAQKRYAGLCSSDLEERIGTLDRYRVLCSHRRGPTGVEQLNPLLARAVHGAQRSARDNYAGRPILILQNDYTSNLFNGDVGVLHAARRGLPLTARFRADTGELRELSLSRLPQHESVYAMTVHKSQGSEFDEVAIVLPEQASPLLTRELLFTAITRARKNVALYANEQVLRATIARSVQRDSGLTQRLTSK